MSYGPDPVREACRTEEKKSWDAPKCNTNKIIYTLEDEVHETILVAENRNGAQECCQAGFDAEGDIESGPRRDLLVACI